MEQNDFLKAMMVLPVKPQFIGFTVNTEELYEKLVAVINEIAGHNISRVCSWSCANEDNEFWFNIDTEELVEMLGDEEYLRVWEKLPFDPESPWEVAQGLIEKLYVDKLGSWAFATVRSWDNTVTEVQLGIPRNL
jgi:hypothetical protein